MKVATRITVATAVVVAIASATYAYFDMRGRVAEKQAWQEREARAVAGTLRATYESQASAFKAPNETQLRELSRPTGGWKVIVIPKARAALPAASDATTAQLRRLNTLPEVPQMCGG